MVCSKTEQVVGRLPWTYCGCKALVADIVNLNSLQLLFSAFLNMALKCLTWHRKQLILLTYGHLVRALRCQARMKLTSSFRISV